MTFFEGASKNSVHIPVFNKSEVFDVTGAGDTVIATLTLALCSGANYVQASILGNLAASLVVKQFGTATTTVEEMVTALDEPELMSVLSQFENRVQIQPNSQHSSVN
jgi:bifunctional ADP-heptose synthase (sugar kinase/adenylyltransferase)